MNLIDKLKALFKKREEKKKAEQVVTRQPIYRGNGYITGYDDNYHDTTPGRNYIYPDYSGGSSNDSSIDSPSSQSCSFGGYQGGDGGGAGATGDYGNSSDSGSCDSGGSDGGGGGSD